MKTIRMLPSLVVPLFLLSSCASLSAGSSERPNSYLDIAAQPKEKDPYNYLDPAPGERPPSSTPNGKGTPNAREAPTCLALCKPGTHCDASGPVGRCVPDQSPR